MLHRAQVRRRCAQGATCARCQNLRDRGQTSVGGQHQGALHARGRSSGSVVEVRPDHPHHLVAQLSDMVFADLLGEARCRPRVTSRRKGPPSGPDLTKPVEVDRHAVPRPGSRRRPERAVDDRHLRQTVVPSRRRGPVPSRVGRALAPARLRSAARQPVEVQRADCRAGGAARQVRRIARCRPGPVAAAWKRPASAGDRRPNGALMQPARTRARRAIDHPVLVAAPGTIEVQGSVWPTPRPRVRVTREVDLMQVGAVGGQAVEHQRAVVTRRGTTLVGDHRRPRLGRVQGPPPGPRRAVFGGRRDERERVPPATEPDEVTVT